MPIDALVIAGALFCHDHDLRGLGRNRRKRCSGHQARDPGKQTRDAVRSRQPVGAFDARATREITQAAPTGPKTPRRTIRRSELRQIVPLADSTIYGLERRGEFPQRFFLTARCVVWDLAEVEEWLRSRRQPGSNELVKKAPVPDFRKRKSKTLRETGYRVDARRPAPFRPLQAQT
ncbi:phage transcriptional regulator AlpA [Burkholderiales bacterium GJ-E10]|nr:phage transcriptional regulator AlpA [Burkholderiales bacterium GJ-E10]